MENPQANKDPQSVKFVPAICPKCGGQLEVDPSQEAAVCKFCGTPFIVDKAIQNYSIQNAHIDHADNVTVDLKGSVDSVIGMVERRQERIVENENSKELFKDSWKYMLAMFAVLIVVWVIANALGIFN